mmetsp:Transcript_49703/g.41920  ORF Transcript_49703/g.41920 Transcript_49703/m.41920 type:complete len:97 (-) Transcript_49703:295-585(-)
MAASYQLMCESAGMPAQWSGPDQWGLPLGSRNCVWQLTSCNGLLLLVPGDPARFGTVSVHAEPCKGPASGAKSGVKAGNIACAAGFLARLGLQARR